MPLKQAIVLQKKPTSLAKSEDKEREKIISDALEKFALIANRNITPALLDIYVEALSDLPLNRLRAGVKEWLEEGDKFPWPRDIREASELP